MDRLSTSILSSNDIFNGLAEMKCDNKNIMFLCVYICVLIVVTIFIRHSVHIFFNRENTNLETY